MKIVVNISKKRIRKAIAESIDNRLDEENEISKKVRKAIKK